MNMEALVSFPKDLSPSKDSMLFHTNDREQTESMHDVCSRTIPQQPSSSAGASSPDVCQECRQEPSMYRCPRCHHRTCSLRCCQTHKERLNCNGQRKKTEFLPLCRMTDASLRSDYFFLEDALQEIPKAKRQFNSILESKATCSTTRPITPPKKRSRTTSVISNYNTPKSYKTIQNSKKRSHLLQQACKRRSIQLQVLPSFMERHVQNSSWYCKPRDETIWKVQCIFVDQENHSVSFQLSENQGNILEEIMKHNPKAINPDDATPASTSQAQTPSTYLYKVFVKRLPCAANQPRYTEISANLKQALAGLTIVEHPTVYCVPNTPEWLSQFPLGTHQIEIVESQQHDR